MLQKPNFWFTLLSEFVIGGLCMYIFYRHFLKPYAKSKEEEQKEREERRQQILNSRQEQGEKKEE